MIEYKIPKRKNIFEAGYSIISKAITPYIAKTSLTPNQITVISGLFGMAGASLLIPKNKLCLILAGVFIQLFIILDLVDGDIARMKKMCSLYGKWLDILFDKLNDLLLILGLSLGVYYRTGKISALCLGIILMGLVFFIQFSMISNSVIFAKLKRQHKDIQGSDKEVKKKSHQVFFLKKIAKFTGRHLLLEHCAFLFLISFFAIINKLFIGLWFITIHALFTKLFIITRSVYKLKKG